MSAVLSRIRFKPLILFLAFLGFWGIGLGGALRVFIRIHPQGARVDTIRLTLSSVGAGEGANRSVTLIDDKTYSFNGLRSGRYLIRAESPGFRTSETEVEMVSFSRNDRMLATVILEKDPDSPSTLPEPGQDTVSVTTLSIPTEALDEMEKARKASQKNDALKASKHLNKAIEIFPALYQAHNNLAVEYSKLGRFEEAAKALEKSIAIQPDDATTHRNLAQLYLTFGRLAEAFAQVQTALDLEPRDSRSLLLLGKLGIRSGKYETALDFFYQASDIDKADHSHLGIGECLTLLGRHEEALAEFSAFVKLFPKDPRTSGVKTLIASLELDLSARNQ